LTEDEYARAGLILLGVIGLLTLAGYVVIFVRYCSPWRD